jgi:hypothetical protein
MIQWGDGEKGLSTLTSDLTKLLPSGRGVANEKTVPVGCMHMFFTIQKKASFEAIPGDTRHE